MCSYYFLPWKNSLPDIWLLLLFPNNVGFHYYPRFSCQNMISIWPNLTILTHSSNNTRSAYPGEDKFLPDTHFSTHIPSPPNFSWNLENTPGYPTHYSLTLPRVLNRPEDAYWQISVQQFYIIVLIQKFYPFPYGFNPTIWLFHSLYTLYMDCITLILRFRICKHNLSLWNPIIRDCQDAIPRSVDILLTSLILRTPFNVASKWE